jgi:DNA-directed RNA polymerase alpha subunit
MGLTELGLSGGLLRCLNAEGITTAAELCVSVAAELLEIPGLGSKRLAELRLRLAASGLWLYGEQEAGGQ